MFRSPYKPQAGRFLISEPFMDDPNFVRSVVLLVEHDAAGSIGFVLNRRLTTTLNEVIDELPYCHSPIFLGGPVGHNTLHYLHRLGDTLPNSHAVCEGVYWGGHFEHLTDMLRANRVQESDVLFFVGYSGWGAGQLDAELARGSWIVAPANEAFVFDTPPEGRWQELLRDMGNKYRILSNYPTDPRLN